MKYTKKEILGFLKSSHKQRMQIETHLPNQDEITYELSILFWIEDLELLEWDKLCRYYCEVFEIQNHIDEFRSAMLPIKDKTIEDFCQFVAENAQKPKLAPVKLFGKNCVEAGIFKYLISRLNDKNENEARKIRPSTKLSDFMEVFAFKIVEEVNRINPNILPLINFKTNIFEKHGLKVFLLGLVISVFSYWGIVLLISGIVIYLSGLKIRAEKFEFEEIETFRDLVELIKQNNYIHQIDQ